MNTLIELYDERAIENILAPDMFRPRRIDRKSTRLNSSHRT